VCFRLNLEVNGWWMCDEGRLSHEDPQARARIGHAEVRNGSGFQPAMLEEAVRNTAALLKAAPEGAAVIASGNLSVEDLWLLRKLQDAVTGLRAVVPERNRGENDGFLIRADKTANRKGAEILGFDIDAGGAASRALMEEVASGKVKTVISLGEEIETLPGGEAALKVLETGGSLVTMGPYQTASSGAAGLRIPAAAYGEAEGTWVNYSGRAQRVRRGITPRVAALPYWKILSLLLSELGVETSFDSAAQILRQVAEAVPAFEGMSWTALGAEGKALKPGKGVPEPVPPPNAMPRPAWVSHA
jgi:NADH-quinone oxidoreductase subunit G